MLKVNTDLHLPSTPQNIKELSYKGLPTIKKTTVPSYFKHLMPFFFPLLHLQSIQITDYIMTNSLGWETLQELTSEVLQPDTHLQDRSVLRDRRKGRSSYPREQSRPWGWGVGAGRCRGWCQWERRSSVSRSSPHRRAWGRLSPWPGPWASGCEHRHLLWEWKLM